MKNVLQSKSSQSTTKLDKYIGEKLVTLRKGRGFSQAHLAGELGITFQQIQKYEKAKNRISSSRLYEISRILRVSILDFFEGYEDQAEDPVPIYNFQNDRDFQKLVHLWPSINNKDMKKNLVHLLRSSTGP